MYNRQTMFVSYTVTVGSFLRNIVKSVFKRQTVCMSVRGVKILATAPPPRTRTGLYLAV